MSPPNDPPRPATGPEPYSSGVVRRMRPATIDDVVDKVDALARDRATDERRAVDIQEALGRAIIRTDAVGARLDRAEEALLAELGPTRATADKALSEVRQVRGIVARHGTELVALRSSVGHPADPAAAMRASSSDTTPEELAKRVDLGTGLYREVAELRALVMTLWRRGRWVVGLGAVAAAVSPHVPAIVAAITR